MARRERGVGELFPLPTHSKKPEGVPFDGPLELIGGADHELEAHAQRRMNVRDILAVGLSGRRDLEPILRGMRAQLGDEVLRESGRARNEEARSASEWHDIMLTKAEEAEREASPAPPLQDVARQEERGVRERQQGGLSQPREDEEVVEEEEAEEEEAETVALVDQ